MTSVGRTALTAAVALVSAACTSETLEGPPQLPATVVPASWSAPVGAGEAWPRPGWWRGFGSAELDRLIAAAREGNPDLGAAAARVLQARARARIARAPLLPNVDAAASADRFGRHSGAKPGAGLALSAGAAFELDFWGRNAADAASAQAALAASRYDRETVALTITGSTAATYFLVLSLRERIALARLNLANAERVLGLVEARAAAGAVSPLDVARQRAQVEGQRAGIPPLEAQEFEARAALALLLGRAPQALRVEARDLGGIDAPAVGPGLPSALLARRPDIHKAEADLAAAAADIAAARAAFYPEVILTGSLSSGSNALTGLFQGTNIAYAVGASLLQTIFDGGARAGAEDLAVARRLELVQAYRAAVIAAMADVDAALMALDALNREENLRRREAAEARAAFDFAETRYRSGAEDLLSVLDAQRTLFQAQDSVARVRHDRLSALVTLYRVLGGGWEAAIASENGADVRP